MKTILRNNCGFTLIEFLVVIAINCLKQLLLNPWVKTVATLALLLVTLGLGSKPPDAAQLYLETVGRWPGFPRGNVISMHVVGNHAFLGLQVFGPGGCSISSRGWAGRVEVLDIKDPAKPVRVGGFRLEKTPTAMGSVSNFLYVADGPYLRCFDISKPATPVAVCATVLPGSIRSMLVDGNRTFLGLMDSYRLVVMDISNPAQMVELAHSQEGIGVEDMRIAGNCLLACYFDGIFVFDISDLAKLRYVTNYVILPGSSQAVHVITDVAYVKTSAGIEVLNVQDPKTPKLIKQFPGNASNSGLASIGSFLFQTQSNQFQILDIADPQNLKLINQVEMEGTIDFFHISSRLAFIYSQNSGLTILDLADPAHPTRIGSHDTSGAAESIQVQGRYAYLADGYAGLQIIDISDPTQPRKTRQYKTGFYARAVGLSGTFACVIGGEFIAQLDTNNFQLRMIDVSDPTHPKAVGMMELPGQPEGLKVVHDKVYVIAGKFVCLVDISQPTLPKLITSVNLESEGGSSITGIDFAGDYSYVGTTESQESFKIINMTNAEIVSVWPNKWLDTGIKGVIQGIQVRGSYAYVLSASEISGGDLYRSNGVGTPPGKLLIFDISIPKMLRLVAECQIGGRARNIYLDGNYAYVAGGAWDEKQQDWRNGLEIVDIRNPLQPVRMRACDIGGYARDVKVKDGYAYLAAGDQGLIISVVHLPSAPIIVLEQPLNQRTLFNNPVSLSFGVYSTNTLSYQWYLGHSGDTSHPIIGATSAVYKTPPLDRTTVFWARSIAPNGSVDSQTATISVLSAMAFEPLGVCSFHANPLHIVTVQGNYAYLTSQNMTGGIKIINVSDPTWPRLEGVIATDRWDMAMVGHFAYCASRNGLQIIDLSNPAKPLLAGTWNTNSPIYTIKVADSYAYVIADISSLQILDLSDPVRPVLACTMPISSDTSILPVGDYIYMVQRNDFNAFALNNPMPPRWIGNCSCPSYGSSLDYEPANRWVIATGSSIDIFDVSKPAQPVKIGGIINETKDSWITSSSITGNLIYVTIIGVGLQVYEVSNPAQPACVGSWITTGRLLDVQAIGDKIYIVDENQGLVILKATPVLQLNPPTISGRTLTLSWPEFPGVKLQRASSLYQPIWEDVAISNRQSVIEMPMQEASGYFRLRKP